MAKLVNPYVAGAPLRGERGFFGRQDTLEWVARELRNPATNALVLFGQRRIGKTSLLLQLQRTLPADVFLSVYFDLQDQATRPLGRVLADLADTVAERVDMEMPDPDAFDDQRRFFRRTFLPQLYQALEENRRPVFLLDEFDVLDQTGEAELPRTSAAGGLFPFLRQVMTEEPRLAFIFVVGRRAEDLSLDFMATFKASLVQEIWVLDRESAKALVRQAEANNTLRFTDLAVERVLNLTRCHPYLTQLLCQRIWERAYMGNPTAPPRIDTPEVEAAVPDALEAGSQALVWLWNGLSPAEKIYAAALAETAGEGETIAEDQVIQMLTAYAARLRTREVELAPRDLVKRRVLEAAGEREYRFAVELFRRWLCQHKPLRDVKDEIDRLEPLAEQLSRIGQRSFSRREWEEAVDLFQRALTRNPRHLRARLHLGVALLEQGQTDEAVAELEQAYELDRDEARLSLARALVIQAKEREEAGDEDGALAASEQALQVSPNEQEAQEIRAAIWTRRGDVALKGNDPETALAAYREVGDAEKIAQVAEFVMAKIQKDDSLGVIYDLARNCYEAGDWLNAIKGLKEVVNKAPKYKDATSLLEDAEKQVKLATLYGQGREAFAAEDWETARDRFQRVLHINPDYQNAKDLYDRAHKEIELPKLDSQVEDQWQNYDWDGAIETLSAILDLDPHYKNAPALLEQAIQKGRLEEDYQRASKLYGKAEETGQESDWREAAKLLKQIAIEDPGYRTVSVSPKLAYAQRRLKFFELSRKGKDHYAREEWEETVTYLEQATDLDSLAPDLVAMLAEAQEKLKEQETAKNKKMLEFYEKGSEYYQRKRWKETIDYLEEASAIEPNRADLQTKLSEARRNLRRQHSTRIALGILNVIVFTIAVALFQNQIATVGDSIMRWWLESRATPTPTIAIPGIDRIEVWMDGGQLDPDRLPSLTGGEAVELEVIVFDTNGERYVSDDLVCMWSVAPLGDGDKGINTDLCKTFYTPSQEYSSQTIIFEAEGREQQFRPGDSVSMKFDIVK